MAISEEAQRNHDALDICDIVKLIEEWEANGN